MTLPPLRPYQNEIVAAVEAAWSRGERAPLVVAATGTGKTRTIAELLLRARDRGQGRALFLVERKRLAEQTAATLIDAGLTAEIESGDSIASIRGDMFTSPCDVVVGLVQSMRGSRLEKWPPIAFSTIVFDECHHATGPGYRTIRARFPSARVVGCTATPDRGDGVGIVGEDRIFSSLVYEYGIERGTDEGYLAPIRGAALGDVRVDLSSVRVTRQAHGRDLRAEDIALAISKGDLLPAICKQIVQECGDRSTLIFAPTVASAHSLAAELVRHTDAGVASVDGESSASERDGVIARFTSGEVQFVANCALYTEGVDLPRTSAIVNLRPTKSRALYTQMVGRGTRLFPGKADCIVFDLTQAIDTHSLVTPTDLLGKPMTDRVKRYAKAALDEGVSVVEAARKAEARAAKEDRERSERLERERRAKIEMRIEYAKREVDLLKKRTKARERKQAKKDAARSVAGEGLRDRLKQLGVKVPPTATDADCAAMMKRVREREAKGLCSLKQAKVLRDRGLKWRDVSREEAKTIITQLQLNKWRVTDALRARYAS